MLIGVEKSLPVPATTRSGATTASPGWSAAPATTTSTARAARTGLEGGSGDDRLHGHDGDDTLAGGAGGDRLRGDAARTGSRTRPGQRVLRSSGDGIDFAESLAGSLIGSDCESLTFRFDIGRPPDSQTATVRVEPSGSCRRTAAPCW